VIAVQELVCRFGERAAVDRLTLTVGAGAVCGLLGPNGAGKSTTLRALVGLGTPSEGTASVLGFDAQGARVEVLRRVGYVPDTADFDGFLTVRELLEFAAEVHGFRRSEARERAREGAARWGLADALDRAVGGFSLGERKRLGLALATLHEPTVLLLDEPTNALDPRGQALLKDAVRRVAGDGGAVLLSTHQVALAEALCTEIVVLHRGRCVARGPVPALWQERDAPSLEALYLQVTEDGPAP
jgi:ABC-2 type transport system ATP-binding protein